MPLERLLEGGPHRSIYPGYLKTHYTELAVDSTTSSTTFVDLLSLTFTTDAGILLIHLDATFQPSSGAGYMQLVVDGTPVRGAGSGTTAKTYMNLAVSHQSVVTPGSHTVKMQWRTTSGTIVCRPVSFTYYHATVLVQEVSV